MRTLHDLEEAFRALADTAPEPAPLSSPAAPLRTAARGRRRWVAPAAAAAAMVTLVGGIAGIVAANSGGNDNRPTTGSGDRNLPVLAAPRGNETPPLTFEFTATPPAAGLVPSYEVDRAGQAIEFVSPSKRRSCSPAQLALNCGVVGELVLHYVNPPKDPDEPTTPLPRSAHRVPVRVNGHPGFYARITRLLSTVEVLYWQYAPGAWAEATAPSRAAELALAESARPASVPLPVPVAPARVSAGQYVNTLASDPADRAGGYEVAGRGAGYYVSWGRPLDGESAFERPGAEHVTINGHDWTIIGGRQPAARLDGPVPVAVQPYDGTSRNRLLDVLRGLRVAGDLSDPGSWFAAAEVLG